MNEAQPGVIEPCGLVVTTAMDHTGTALVMFHAVGTPTMIGIPLVSLPMLIEHLQKTQEDAPEQMEQMMLMLSGTAGSA